MGDSDRMVTTAEFRSRGYGFRQELRIRDEWKYNRTARQMRHLPPCIKCGHRGARMEPMFYMDVYRCRWGHEVTELELHRWVRANG